MNARLDRVPKSVKRILLPPGSGDPANLAFSVVHVITLVECLRPLFLIFTAILNPILWPRVSVISAYILLTSIGCNLWNRRGHTRSAGLIFLLQYNISLFYSAWTSGGVRSSAMATLVVVTFWAGFLLKPRYATVVALINMASGLIFAWAASWGWLPSITRAHTDASYWVQNMFNILLLFVTQQTVNALVARNLATQALALQKEKEAKEEVMRLSKIKDEFLITLSHELRTPLTSVLGWAELLKENCLDEESKDMAIDTILRNARLQVQLVNDLLDLSQTVQEEIVLDFKSVPVPELIQEVIEILEPSASQKNISFSVSGSESAAYVWVDRERMRQVLWNIAVNAIKFSPEGSTVQVRLRADRSRVWIEFQDQGAGITPEYLPHVFERFSQQDSSRSRTYGGLGIGLALAKEYVDLMGGHIQAESPGPGRGATFTVSFPRHDAPRHNSGREERVSF